MVDIDMVDMDMVDMDMMVMDMEDTNMVDTVDIFQGWIFFRGENIQRWIFSAMAYP